MQNAFATLRRRAPPVIGIEISGKDLKPLKMGAKLTNRGPYLRLARQASDRGIDRPARIQ
jgi:hypothetical protein